MTTRAVSDSDSVVAPAPYAALTPSVILDAVDAGGYRADGRLLALSSYENRVYQVGLEDGGMLVVKFYRPGRWTDEAIHEEHAYALELAARELPVVAPLVTAAGSLLVHAGFRYALYPRRGGRTPELADPDTLLQLGRFVGRLHAVGALAAYRHRYTLDLDTYGRVPHAYVLAGGFVPDDLRAAYSSVVADLFTRMERAVARAPRVERIRVHGDCHAGNILWTDGGPHFVDLDDTCMAPAVQDVWLALSGDRASMTLQLSEFMEGYRQFRDFDRSELHLVEVLRTLRLIHYAGWLARRWHDPAFPANFPFFNTQRYWQDHILELREQAAALDEPPLELM